MKTKLFFFLGVLCLALISYDLRLRFYLSHAIMGGASCANKEKFMALRDEWAKRYGDENLYHITNIYGIIGVSILLGFISMLFFFLILISIEKAPIKSKINFLKKIMLTALLVSASVITFLNLFSLM